jgi:hypothetical protein
LGGRSEVYPTDREGGRALDRKEERPARAVGAAIGRPNAIGRMDYGGRFMNRPYANTGGRTPPLQTLFRKEGADRSRRVF